MPCLDHGHSHTVKAEVPLSTRRALELWPARPLSAQRGLQNVKFWDVMHQGFLLASILFYIADITLYYNIYIIYIYMYESYVVLYIISSILKTVHFWSVFLNAIRSAVVSRCTSQGTVQPAGHWCLVPSDEKERRSEFTQTIFQLLLKNDLPQICSKIGPKHQNSCFVQWQTQPVKDWSRNPSALWISLAVRLDERTWSFQSKI